MRKEIDTSDQILHYGGYVLRGFVYVMMLTPAVIVFGASFTSGLALTFPPKGFSLQWYERTWNSEQFMGAMATSGYLALASTLVVLIIGLTGAFVLDRYRFTGRSMLEALVLSPIIVPMVVLALALLQFISWLGINQTFSGLLVGHILITLPYVVRTLGTGLGLLDKTLEDASLNLAATPLTTLRRITIPILTPSIIAAAVFAFVISFGNVTLSIFLSSASTVTLPVQIFSFVESSYDPTVAAVSSIVIAITLVVIILIEKVVGVTRVVGK